jgi:hypothetical protein
MKEDTKEETNMDNTKEQKRMEALAKKHEEAYPYGANCVPVGSTDSGTPLDTEFFGVRMLNGDIHNLTGMHRRDRIIAQAYITSDGMQHITLNAPRQEVLERYSREEFEVDCIVVLKMLPFTYGQGYTFYTNDWSRPIAAPITPLVEVVAELSDLTIETPVDEWTHTQELLSAVSTSARKTSSSTTLWDERRTPSASVGRWMRPWPTA